MIAQPSVGVFNPSINDVMDFHTALMNMMPPLKRRQVDFPNTIPQPQMAIPSQQEQMQQMQQKLDHKERNRLAAQKWRAKKDQSLSTLEDENDHLRKSVYDLQSQALQLHVENKILESELQYFQQFMSKIMSVAPRSQK